MWLQNIDSKELSYKFFECNILERCGRYSVPSEPLNVKLKRKRLRDAQPHCLIFYFYFIGLKEIIMS